MTGSAITSAAGSVGNLHSLPVSGQAGTLAQGSVAQDHSLALAGSAATVAQGSVSVPGNVTVALTGIQATFAADALVPAIACAASGSAVAATAGSLAPEWAVALSGAQIVAASGIVLREGDVTVLIDGQQITAIAGTVVVGAQVGYLDATVIVLPDARIHSRCSGIFVGNDSILALQDLVDRNENAIANAAVSLVEFQDDDGDEPAGLSLPLSLLPSAQGLNTYEARLPHTLDLAVGTLYRAKVRAAAGSLVGEWVEPVLAKRRVA